MTSLDLEDLGSPWPLIPPAHATPLWYCGVALVLITLAIMYWRSRR